MRWLWREKGKPAGIAIARCRTGYEQPVFHTERVGALSEVRIAGLVERYAK